MVQMLLKSFPCQCFPRGRQHCCSYQSEYCRHHRTLHGISWKSTCTVTVRKKSPVHA